MKILLPLLIAAISFSGCVSTESNNPATAHDVKSQSIVLTDPYIGNQAQFLKGPYYSNDTDFITAKLYLAVLHDGNKVPLYTLKGMFLLHEWLFLDDVRDINQSEGIAFLRHKREALRGNVSESVTCIVTKDYLKERITSGIDVKFYGSKGNFVARLPGYYIKGFLEAEEQMFNK